MDELRFARRLWRVVGSVGGTVTRFQALALAGGLALGLTPLVSGPAGSGIVPLPYAPASAHEAYGYSLAERRLMRSGPGLAWVRAAEAAVLAPTAVELPLAVDVASAPFDDPRAYGYAFAVDGGRRLQIEVAGAQSTQRPFVDLFRDVGGRLERVVSAWPETPGRTTNTPAAVAADIIESGGYVLRVQSSIGASDTYRVSADTGPLLAFPVAGHGLRAIQSGFGAERDGGRRAHRGIDIFAARGTPALAATDAWVVRVETTRIGGNVVWLQPLFGGMRLYYAHLDRQAVRRGQLVLAGEEVGYVGNTGNAVTTPTHLHFGVYVRRTGRRGGARDPVSFLQ